jgi:hypothetical protein
MGECGLLLAGVGSIDQQVVAEQGPRDGALGLTTWCTLAEPLIRETSGDRHVIGHANEVNNDED